VEFVSFGEFWGGRSGWLAGKPVQDVSYWKITSFLQLVGALYVISGYLLLSRELSAKIKGEGA